jgi:hypothetical protein
VYLPSGYIGLNGKLPKGVRSKDVLIHPLNLSVKFTPSKYRNYEVSRMENVTLLLKIPQSVHTVWHMNEYGEARRNMYTFMTSNAF